MGETVINGNNEIPMLSDSMEIDLNEEFELEEKTPESTIIKASLRVNVNFY